MEGNFGVRGQRACRAGGLAIRAPSGIAESRFPQSHEGTRIGILKLPYCFQESSFACPCHGVLIRRRMGSPHLYHRLFPPWFVTACCYSCARAGCAVTVRCARHHPSSSACCVIFHSICAAQSAFDSQWQGWARVWARNGARALLSAVERFRDLACMPLHKGATLDRALRFVPISRSACLSAFLQQGWWP